MRKKRRKICAEFIKKRGLIQFAAAVLTNIHLHYFLKGRLYTGGTKSVCVPGLNCYSCPAAAGACPIGAFQAVVGSSKYKFCYYITGILILIGVMAGRFICGFLCPFGWLQDLLHKIPTRKFSTKKVWFLRYFKYVLLFAAVWLIPVLFVNNVGMGVPFFCKYICPQGILEGGIPLSLANPSIAAAIGPLFRWKAVILAVVVILSILVYRPFCKWICPLGAFYSFFNKVSFLQYDIDRDKCISCGKCARVCRMDVDITKNLSSPECIRCGACVKSCPVQALDVRWGCRKAEKKTERK